MKLFGTLKSKIIFGILGLVLIIQATSSTIAFIRLRNAVFETFKVEASATTFLLTLKLNDQLGGMGEVSPLALEVFVGNLVEQFTKLTNENETLHSLKFIDLNGKTLAHNNPKMVGQVIEDTDLLDNSSINEIYSKEEGGEVILMVPYTARDNVVGAMIFNYSNQQLTEKVNESLIIAVGLVLIFMIFGGAGAWFLAKQISRRIDAVSSAVRDIVEGEGDLTRRLGTRANDEVGQLEQGFNAFIENIQKVIQNIDSEASELSITSDELASMTQEIRKTTDELVHTIEQGDSEIDQSNTTIQKMAQAVQSITKEIQQAEQKANLAQQQAEDGNQAVIRADTSMNKIAESSKEIKGIIGVITEISGQTNLLSLNAAIEAAKAGELGKGFAVVADEVRSLAERSNRAVVEIQKLIEDSATNVDEGNSVIQQTSNTLGSIIEQVREISAQVNQISSSMSEQDEAIQEIAKVAMNIRGMSETNASIATELSSATDQLAKASETLNQMSGRLLNQITQFKIK